MRQDGRVFDEQYLLKVAADLLNRKSEIEKLREAVQLAEAERCTSLGTAHQLQRYPLQGAATRVLRLCDYPTKDLGTSAATLRVVVNAAWSGRSDPAFAQKFDGSKNPPAFCRLEVPVQATGVVSRGQTRSLLGSSDFDISEEREDTGGAPD
jgi:hypothetical protein